MKAPGWSEEKIISLLQQAEKGESTIADLCRAHQVSANTFYKWRQKYGGLEVNQAPPRGHPDCANWTRRMAV